MTASKTRFTKARPRTKKKAPRRIAAKAAALTKAKKPYRRTKPPRGQMAYLLDEATLAGLLAGEKSEHITARTTPALIAAARRRTGITSKTALIEVALAARTLPDPVAKFMKEHRGKLGRSHRLDY